MNETHELENHNADAMAAENPNTNNEHAPIQIPCSKEDCVYQTILTKPDGLELLRIYLAMRPGMSEVAIFSLSKISTEVLRTSVF